MKKILVLALLLVFAAVAGGLHFGAGPLLRGGVETAATSALGVNTTVDGASVSLFGGKIGLTGIDVANPKGFREPSAAKLGDIAMSASITSLVTDTVEIESLTIASPVITVEASLTGTNIGRLLANLEGDVKETHHGNGKTPGSDPGTITKTVDGRNETAPGKALRVGVVRITDATVILAQSAFGTNRESYTLAKLDLDELETEPDGTITMPRLIQQILVAIISEVAEKNDLPPQVLALLKSDLALTSLDSVQRTLGELGGNAEELKKGVEKGLETIFGKAKN